MNGAHANVDTMKCDQCALVRIMARYHKFFHIRKKRPNYRKRVRIVKEISENVDNQQHVFVGDSFQIAIAPVLAGAQFFGLMPIINTFSINPNHLAFRWRSLQVLYTIFLTLWGGFFFMFYLKHVLRTGINAQNFAGNVFFGCCTLSLLLFLLLARRWKALAVMWSKNEMVFLRPPYKIHRWSLSMKIRMTTICVVFLALVEHGLSISSDIYKYNERKKRCDFVIKDNWKQYFTVQYAYLFRVLPYSIPMALFIWWINFSLTICWNYMDIFIIIASIGLSTRFNQINDRLSTMRGKMTPESIWYEIRTDYVRLSELLEFVDENLACIILLTCINNLYFICYQLLNVFNKLPYVISYIYFWYSLSYLIGRTICMFLCAASVYEASREPLELIRVAPALSWSTEIERFAEHIVSSEVIALSGMKFFHLTRKLLFGMAGTIVTYELVLLQFDSASRKNQPAANETCEYTQDE